VPDGKATQLLLPSSAWYWPAAHFVHANTLTVIDPARQFVHADATALMAILPASQAMHVFKFDPVTDDDWPELQAMQLVDADAPVVVK
jgi:hypothetical protein